MDLLLNDLRLAARGYLRRPGFTAVAVLALSLGIGANVAIFSVFHAVLLRPLPFEEPDRLVAIWEKNPERGWHQAQVAAANYLDWREQASGFSDMAACNDWLVERSLMIDGEPAIVRGNQVTGNFFEVLGVSPLHGSGFADRHTWSGEPAVTVLAFGLWQRIFGGDPGAVGKVLELGGVAHEILGIMPEGFEAPFQSPELWLPTAWDPESRQQVWFRRAHGLRAVGRLSAGVDLAQAEAELVGIAARLEATYPETNVEMGVGLTSLQEWIVGDSRRPLQILMVAVGLVLLVACANVANMLLARAAGRRSEMAIRQALGGSRSRLALQGLIESLLLASVGGALGLVAGIAAIRPLLAMSPEDLPRLEQFTIDGTLVLFTVGLTILATIAFGVLPALRATAATPASRLAVARRGVSPGRSSQTAVKWLVATEMALTLPLVVGAGLIVRTVWHLTQVEPGFAPDRVLVASVGLPATRYSEDAEVTGFYRRLIEDLRAQPGIEHAAMSSRLPFGNQRWSSDFTAEGWSADRYGVGVRHDEVTPGLFQTMGVPLLRGRDFELSDDLESPLVVIVNQALADRYFPGTDPIGRRIAFDRVAGADSVWRTIVGVVGNVRRESLAVEEKPSFYAPVLQDWTRQLHLLVRTEGDPMAALAPVRERLRILDPTLPLFDVTTLEKVVASAAARERFLLALLSAFAGVALVLAAVGVFGVVSYSTTRRTREIGIRMALGAHRGSVARLILRQGLAPVIAGIAAGLLIAVLTVRSLASMLFGVAPFDPLTFVAVVVLLLSAAVLACALPARRATRVDAVAALRSE